LTNGDLKLRGSVSCPVLMSDVVCASLSKLRGKSALESGREREISLALTADESRQIHTEEHRHASALRQPAREREREVVRRRQRVRNAAAGRAQGRRDRGLRCIWRGLGHGAGARESGESGGKVVGDVRGLAEPDVARAGQGNYGAVHELVVNQVQCEGGDRRRFRAALVGL